MTVNTPQDEQTCAEILKELVKVHRNITKLARIFQEPPINQSRRAQRIWLQVMNAQYYVATAHQILKETALLLQGCPLDGIDDDDEDDDDTE